MQSASQIEAIQQFLGLVDTLDVFQSIEDNMIIEKLSPEAREAYLSERPIEKMISDRYFECVDKYKDIFKSLESNNIENKTEAFLEFASIYKEFGDIKDSGVIEKLSPIARDAYLANRPLDKEITNKYFDIKDRFGDILESEKFEFSEKVDSDTNLKFDVQDEKYEQTDNFESISEFDEEYEYDSYNDYE